MAEVGDGAGRANIREHQMLIVPGSSSSFGGEIGRAVRTDGGDEAQLLFVDHPSHIVCQNAHRVSFIAVSRSAVKPQISRSIPQALPRRLHRPPGAYPMLFPANPYAPRGPQTRGIVQRAAPDA